MATLHQLSNLFNHIFEFFYFHEMVNCLRFHKIKTYPSCTSRSLVTISPSDSTQHDYTDL